MKKIFVLIVTLFLTFTCFSQTSEGYFNSGNEKFKLKDYQGAINEYNKAIEINPRYSEAFHNRGRSKYLNHDPRGAIDDYNKAIDINPEFAEAYANRGISKTSDVIKDYTGAIADGTQAIKISPELDYGYTTLMIAKICIGDLEGATKDALMANNVREKNASPVIKNRFEEKYIRPVIDWVDIPSGIFIMGSPSGEEGRGNLEEQHQVRLSSFKMSKYEITIEQFKAFIDSTGYQTTADKEGGSYFLTLGGKVINGVNWKYDENGKLRNISEYNQPVLHVSWLDAKAFADWMGCRLPTESEWEYACRAGTSTPFSSGSNLSTSQANYDGNSPYNNNLKGEIRKKTLPPGSFQPNQFGLFDMHGNVFEWCSDWYGKYISKMESDPKGPLIGIQRVARGGSWSHSAQICRSANRVNVGPTLSCEIVGFRVVMENNSEKKEQKYIFSDLGGGLNTGMTLKEIDYLFGLGIDWDAMGGMIKSYLPENSGLINEATLNHSKFRFKFNKGHLIDWEIVK